MHTNLVDERCREVERETGSTTGLLIHKSGKVQLLPFKPYTGLETLFGHDVLPSQLD